MRSRIIPISLVAFAAMGLSGPLYAQGWNSEQQEVWHVEEQQWKMSAAEDLTWIDTLVHPNISYWETGVPMPQNRASLTRWNRFSAANGGALEQELLPISIVITGNIAVVKYYYTLVRENYKKDRETLKGHYMDVLVKEGGHWKFIAWAGGEDPQED